MSEMNALLDGKCCRVTLMAAMGGLVIFVPNAFAQQAAASAVTEVGRVIVTGSNIPTAEEVGPNPVDTYRPSDIEKLGIRNPTDLTTFLPQQSGATTNLNMANGGDGTVQFNLRGLLVNRNSGN
jgi:iron complex outermembrane recepter protein